MRASENTGKTENATEPENKTAKLLYRKIKYRSHLKEKRRKERKEVENCSIEVG